MAVSAANPTTNHGKRFRNAYSYRFFCLPTTQTSRRWGSLPSPPPYCLRHYSTEVQTPMISRQDLEGIDAAWIAVDAQGHVALFITAGEGSVPESALPSTEDAETEVLALPESCDCDLLVDVPRPDDFVAIARRGIFAYDWVAAHGLQEKVPAHYALQARPSRPLVLTHLPASLQALAAPTVLSSV